MQPVRRRVERAGEDRGLLAELLEARGGRPDIVADRGQPPVAVRAEADPLDHLRAVAGIGEHLLPRQRDLDRAPQDPRGERRQHRVGMDDQLGAEAAADEGADDADVLRRDAQACWRCRPGSSPASASQV